MKWESYFLDIAKVVATKSKDSSTKVGAVIIGPDLQVISTGYNGFPRNIKDTPERWKEKYSYVVHAEANAIYNAARHGISLRGSHMYIYSPKLTTCVECAKAIIQAGILYVTTMVDDPTPPEFWYKSLEQAKYMLDEAGVNCLNLQSDTDVSDTEST